MPRWLQTLLSNRKGAFGLVCVLGFVLLGLLGPLLVGDPSAFVARPNEPPSLAHWLGTTGQGQDVFAQTVAGAQLTLLVGAVTGALVVAVGALVGGAAGYFGGRVDDGLSLLINVFLVMPGLPLMVVLAAWLPPGPVTMTAVLVLTGWAWNARVIRAQTLSLRQRDFVSAATLSGEGALRIIVVEILPHMASLLVSSFIGATIYAIGAQVGLEFLGLGDISKVTWGTNLYWAANGAALLTGAWWTFVPTGLCVALVGFGLAMLNFGIDELTNPRLSARNHPVHAGPGLVSTPLYEEES
ncbi:MAG: peptide/nickel transport system permease protein [Myxococcota bacterium]|jgi:peptide/nickel transport system permease protein